MKPDSLYARSEELQPLLSPRTAEQRGTRTPIAARDCGYFPSCRSRVASWGVGRVDAATAGAAGAILAFAACTPTLCCETDTVWKEGDTALKQKKAGAPP
jgi:hypothetical protein